MATSPASNPLRVRLDGPPELHAKAAWALEALLARASVTSWELVGPAEPADLVWGSPTLPAAPAAWQFAPDAPPGAAADPLACTFWWLARVEELDAPAAAFDEHGRFRYEASAQARGGDPLAAPVDELARALGRQLASFASPFEGEPAWRLVATHDIDVPWRWTRTGLRRALRSLRDDLRSGRVGSALRTLGALAAAPAWRLLGRDPWCNARAIARLERRYGARSTSYCIVAHHGPIDGDPTALTRGTPRYLQQLAADAGPGAVGLHATYGADEDAGRLAAERSALEQQLGQDVTDHRFHYLRHRPAAAWPHLAEAGLRSDATLGCAEQPGFRAGTAHPFRAWDHAADAPLDLVVIPLAVMDASFDERYLAARGRRERDAQVARVLDAIERVGGSASLLIHNDRLCTITDDGWTRTYRGVLERVRSSGARACTAAEARDAYLARIPAWRRTPAARPVAT